MNPVLVSLHIILLPDHSGPQQQQQQPQQQTNTNIAVTQTGTQRIFTNDGKPSRGGEWGEEKNFCVSDIGKSPW